MPRSWNHLRLATTGLAVFAAASGCQPAARDEARPLVVVASGDTAGWIVPCGCASNQSGGLPRRGSFVAELRREADVVVADVGGTPSGTSAYDRAKFEAVLRGELAMQIAAHNIGRSEALLGPVYLRQLGTRLGVPLVSANACDAEGRLIAQRWRIVEAAGRRVALVGVLSERYATDQVRVTPPGRAILDALEEIASAYDALVVLAYLPDDELRQLAGAIPEADVVVGGPTGQPLPPEPIGPTLLASATNEGKFLARFDAPGAGASGRWSGTIVELDDRLNDDPEQLGNLDAFYRELARRDFTPAQTSFAAPLVSGKPGPQIAGSDRCRACHDEDCRLWDTSRHAHAWDSLRKNGTYVDPACQRCHTTGYGLPGGFESVAESPKRVHVGCESCHGPSREHVDDPEIRTPHFARAKDSCPGCHDRENSPKFVYDTYWAQILHGTSDDVAWTSEGNSKGGP
jgi:hypothetical protein